MLAFSQVNATPRCDSSSKRVKSTPTRRGEGAMGAQRLRWGLGMLVAVGLLGGPGAARGQRPVDLLARTREAQVVAPSPTPRTFGTSSATAHVIGASEFEAFSTALTHDYDAINNHFVKSIAGAALAWVRLPAGAMVTSVELEGCDTDPFDQIELRFLRSPSPAGVSDDVTPPAVTGLMAMPGCGFFSVTPLPAVSPLVIDNDNNTYFIQVTTGSYDRVHRRPGVLHTPGEPCTGRRHLLRRADRPSVLPLHRGAGRVPASRRAAAAATSARTPR